MDLSRTNYVELVQVPALTDELAESLRKKY